MDATPSRGSLLAEVDGDPVPERGDQRVARARGRLAGAVRARDRERPGRGEHRARQRVVRDPTPTVLASPPSAQPAERSVRPSTIVRGPGQQAAAKVSARSSKTATSRACSADATRTGSVRSGGRSFAANRSVVGVGIVGPRPDPVDGVGRDHDQRAPLRGGHGLGDRRGGHGRRAATTRSRPARSRCTSGSANPASTASAAIAAAEDSSISTTTLPPGRRRASAWVKSRP